MIARKNLTMKKMNKIKKYRLICYIKVEPEESEQLTYEEALGEKEQGEFLFPENIYRIEELK